MFALMALSLWQVANLAAGSTTGSTHPVALPQSAPTSGSGAYFDHVVIILMENQGIFDICRSTPPPCSTSGPAPYMAGLANNYGIGSQYLSLINTSQPNYVALIGGSTLGCTSNGCPTITAPNLVDRFEAAGLSWKGYFENQSLAAGCDTISNEPYATIHNPFIAFQDITNNTARCNNLVLANPSTCGSVTDCALINDLNSDSSPNFMWLTPNDCNDMKGATGICSSSISLGDNYLASLVPGILNSKTFQTGRSALFITFDEGNGYCPLNGSSENCVYSVWAGPVAKTGFGTTRLYNHYSFPKTIEANWNRASLSTGDGNATSMAEFFIPSAPDFSISTSPTELVAAAGSSSNVTVTLTSLANLTGTVNLSAKSSPSGLSLTLSPANVSLTFASNSTSVLSVSSPNPGSFTVTITGTSGSLLHQATVKVSIVPVIVGDFSIAASPSSITISKGSSASSTISLMSLGGFTGTISLSVVVSPGSGPKTMLSGSSVTLTLGGQGSSILDVRAQHKTPIGTYTITVTGTSGLLAHYATITVNVTA